MKRACISLPALALAALMGSESVNAQGPRATLGAPIETRVEDSRTLNGSPAERVLTNRPQATGTAVQLIGQKSQPVREEQPAVRVMLDQLQTPVEFLSARASYLHWWTRGQSLPALVTTSPNRTAQASAGVIGAPGTQVVVGNERFNDEPRSGGRFSLIFWRDPAQSLGVEADFLFLVASDTHFNAASTGDPILARPIFNALTGKQDSILTAYPGLVTGGIRVVSSTGTLYGGELNLRSNIMRSDYRRLDIVVGYRFLGISDRVNVFDTEIDAQTLDRVDVVDRFRSESQFHGGQVGVVAEWRRGRYHVDFTGKVALGGTSNSVDIDGVSRFNDAAPVPGGVLAVQSNIGQFRSSRFAVLPEVGISAGYHVTSGLRVFASYTFIYLTDVTRAAEQINLTINPNQLPPVVPGGPAQPAFQFHYSDYWAHGLQLGMELRF